MKRVELFAYPAWHSLSPAMHNVAFQALGIDARYVAREVPPEELPGAVENLRHEDVLGANVTIPHKERVMGLLDSVTHEARAVGAVNTISRMGDELEGHNTDVAGFLRALADLAFDAEGCQALLLGAGGAARAVAYALLMSGAGPVFVHNRTIERAERLADEFSYLGDIQAVSVEELEGVSRSCTLVVNATSVGLLRQGMAFDETPLPPEFLPETGAVFDLIYRPAVTRLMRDAEAKGLRTQNGLSMLVYQGADAFSRWTGYDPPIELMREAAENMLAG